MFKKLSIFTVILSGILLAGCANQQSASTQSAPKTEQSDKSSDTKTPKKSTKSTVATEKSNNTTDDEAENNTKNNDVSSGTTSQSSDDQTTSNTQNNNNKTNDSNTTDNSQSSQQTQTQQTVNLTTSDQAVEYLADQLSNTYDKTTTQYVANGKVTWDNVSGYQINIYTKNSDSPVGSYLVPANGQYFQIW